jgi:hypothetical protein
MGNDMSSDLFSHIWGPTYPDIIFYLPTPPVLPTQWQASQMDAITQLIDVNGNHWRKIVTIMAKICCLEHDINIHKGAYWKRIRDNLFSEPDQLQQQLLYQQVSTRINVPRLRCQLRIVNPSVNHMIDLALATSSWHIVCGKEVQLRLGIRDPGQYSPLDEQQTIPRQHKVLLTPYLDYRQYSNKLIELTRQHIAREK